MKHIVFIGNGLADKNADYIKIEHLDIEQVNGIMRIFLPCGQDVLVRKEKDEE